jgi:hypothetical protein
LKKCEKIEDYEWPKNENVSAFKESSISNRTIPVKQDVPNHLLDKLIKVYSRLRSFCIRRGILSRQTC